MFKNSWGIKSRDDKPTFIILIVPPVEKGFKRLTSGIDGPIKLRSKVIQPSFIQPFLKICWFRTWFLGNPKNVDFDDLPLKSYLWISIKRLIRIHTDDSGRISRSPDTKWRNTKLYPWFDTLDNVIRWLNHMIDIVTTPVSQWKSSTVWSISCIGCRIGEIWNLTVYKVGKREISYQFERKSTKTNSTESIIINSSRFKQLYGTIAMHGLSLAPHLTTPHNNFCSFRQNRLK